MLQPSVHQTHPGETIGEYTTKTRQLPTPVPLDDSVAANTHSMCFSSNVAVVTANALFTNESSFRISPSTSPFWCLMMQIKKRREEERRRTVLLQNRKEERRKGLEGVGGVMETRVTEQQQLLGPRVSSRCSSRHTRKPQGSTTCSTLTTTWWVDPPPEPARP